MKGKEAVGSKKTEERHSVSERNALWIRDVSLERQEVFYHAAFNS